MGMLSPAFVSALSAVFTNTAVISALTAVFTVTLTVWLYQLRDKLNALRAVKSEATQNKDTAEGVIEHLAAEKKLREEGKERMTSIQPLSNSSYQNMKNTGVLTKLSDDTRETISKHYSHLDYANHQLEYRQQMRTTSRALSGFSEMIEVIDGVIEAEMVQLGAVDVSVSPDVADHPDIDEALEQFQTFRDVVEAVDEELARHPILTRLI